MRPIYFLKMVWFHYREFVRHPEFRGPNFNWITPLKLAWARRFFVLFFAAWLLGGCSPLRGYKFATHGPGDTSAGDLTHAGEPGARVVVPKKAAKGPVYIRAFDRPHSDCVEVDHHVGDKLKTWACATK